MNSLINNKLMSLYIYFSLPTINFIFLLPKVITLTLKINLTPMKLKNTSYYN